MLYITIYLTPLLFTNRPITEFLINIRQQSESTMWTKVANFLLVRLYLARSDALLKGSLITYLIQ